MESLTLHQMPPSGNSYKVRLTAALLGIKLRFEDYEPIDGATRTPEFLSKINSNGKLPVLQIGNDTFLPESNAVMYYLAESTQLVPRDRLAHAQMLQWMFFEQYSHEPYIATLRFFYHILGKSNLSEEQQAGIPGKKKAGEAALDVMNKHLSDRPFFVGDAFTLADISLYAYTHVAHDAEFNLAQWPNVRNWCARVSKQAGYVPIL